MHGRFSRWGCLSLNAIATYLVETTSQWASSHHRLCSYHTTPIAQANSCVIREDKVWRRQCQKTVVGRGITTTPWKTRKHRRTKNMNIAQQHKQSRANQICSPPTTHNGSCNRAKCLTYDTTVVRRDRIDSHSPSFQSCHIYDRHQLVPAVQWLGVP